MISWNKLQISLEKYYSNNVEIAYILSPYINPNVLIKILGHRPDQPTIIVTSWHPDNLLSGSSTLEIYEVTRNMGWHLYINDRLHVKLYSDSLTSAWIGSANLTRKGLQDDKTSNIEALTFLKTISRDDRIYIQQIIANSTLVTNDIYELYWNWLDKQEKASPPKIEPLDIPPEMDEYNFLTSQLPASLSPSRMWEIANNLVIEFEDWGEMEAMEHDIALYNVAPHKDKEEFFAELKVRFFSHPFIVALTEQITEDGIRFGGIKEWIHRNCTDVPVPYRRALTSHVQSLIRWFVELAPKEFEIIRPHFSEIIKRTK